MPNHKESPKSLSVGLGFLWQAMSSTRIGSIFERRKCHIWCKSQNSSKVCALNKQYAIFIIQEPLKLEQFMKVDNFNCATANFVCV